MHIAPTEEQVLPVVPGGPVLVGVSDVEAAGLNELHAASEPAEKEAEPPEVTVLPVAVQGAEPYP